MRGLLIPRGMCFIWHFQFFIFLSCGQDKRSEGGVGLVLGLVSLLETAGMMKGILYQYELD